MGSKTELSWEEMWQFPDSDGWLAQLLSCCYFYLAGSSSPLPVADTSPQNFVCSADTNSYMPDYS